MSKEELEALLGAVEAWYDDEEYDDEEEEWE